MQAKYLNLFTDFGFKKIFGEEASKNLLIDFLNALLPLNSHIKELTFKNTELLSQSAEDRKVIYDIYCENGLGEKFIVEAAKGKTKLFQGKDGLLCHIPHQGTSGKRELELQPESGFLYWHIRLYL